MKEVTRRETSWRNEAIRLRRDWDKERQERIAMTKEILCLKAELNHAHQKFLTERDKFQRAVDHWERKESGERERRYKEE